MSQTPSMRERERERNLAAFQVRHRHQQQLAPQAEADNAFDAFDAFDAFEGFTQYPPRRDNDAGPQGSKTKTNKTTPASQDTWNRREMTTVRGKSKPKPKENAKPAKVQLTKAGLEMIGKVRTMCNMTREEHLDRLQIPKISLSQRRHSETEAGPVTELEPLEEDFMADITDRACSASRPRRSQFRKAHAASGGDDKTQESNTSLAAKSGYNEKQEEVHKCAGRETSTLSSPTICGGTLSADDVRGSRRRLGKVNAPAELPDEWLGEDALEDDDAPPAARTKYTLTNSELVELENMDWMASPSSLAGRTDQHEDSICSSYVNDNNGSTQTACRSNHTNIFDLGSHSRPGRESLVLASSARPPLPGSSREISRDFISAQQLYRRQYMRHDTALEEDV